MILLNNFKSKIKLVFFFNKNLPDERNIFIFFKIHCSPSLDNAPYYIIYKKNMCKSSINVIQFVILKTKSSGVNQATSARTGLLSMGTSTNFNLGLRSI